MLKKILSLLFIVHYSLFILFPVNAAELAGTTTISITSDTAANAKNMALSEARRIIIGDVLMKYTYGSDFPELVKDAPDDELNDMISSVNIEGEKLSATTYSANIKMTIDQNAAKIWLGDNEIPNSLGLDDFMDANKIIVMIELPGGLRDFIELNRILRESGIVPDVKRISGGTITAVIEQTQKKQIISAVQSGGWQTTDNNDGFIRIWK